MNLKCELVEKVSKEGNHYKCLILYLTDTYEKVVYLKSAELELFKMYYLNNEDKPDTEFWK